jgi:hypothetical protein
MEYLPAKHLLKSPWAGLVARQVREGAFAVAMIGPKRWDCQIFDNELANLWAKSTIIAIPFSYLSQPLHYLAVKKSTAPSESYMYFVKALVDKPAKEVCTELFRGGWV